jgi:hypothetical protein
MEETMRNGIMSMVTGLGLSVLVAACAGQNKEPKTAPYNANASGSAAAGAQPLPKSGLDDSPDSGAATTASDAGVPPDNSVPPSERPVNIDVVLDGVTSPVADGASYAIAADRMLFFYSSAAAPDCANVAVENLVKRPLGGLCQIGFMPKEQGLKCGDEKPASISVGSTRRSFRVKAL